jgi:hypothetical protein
VAKLCISHRDREEVEMCLRRDGQSWFVEDDDAPPASPQRSGTLGILACGPMSAAQVAMRMGTTPDAARRLLQRMARSGQAVRVGRGIYRAAP